MRGVSHQKAQTRSKLRSAIMGLEDKFSVDQAESVIMNIVKSSETDRDLEQVLRQLLAVDRCSHAAARHRYRSVYMALLRKKGGRGTATSAYSMLVYDLTLNLRKGCHSSHLEDDARLLLLQNSLFFKAHIGRVYTSSFHRV